MRGNGQGWQFLLPVQLGACTLEFNPVSERIVSGLRVEGQILTVICAYGPNISSTYSPFLESLEGVLESAPPGYSLVLRGDLSAHVGSDSESLEGHDSGRMAPLT